MRVFVFMFAWLCVCVCVCVCVCGCGCVCVCVYTHVCVCGGGRFWRRGGWVGHLILPGCTRPLRGFMREGAAAARLVPSLLVSHLTGFRNGFQIQNPKWPRNWFHFQNPNWPRDVQWVTPRTPWHVTPHPPPHPRAHASGLLRVRGTRRSSGTGQRSCAVSPQTRACSERVSGGGAVGFGHRDFSRGCVCVCAGVNPCTLRRQ